MERNPCHDLGCPAACCRNIHGEVPIRSEYFLNSFPEAIALNSSDEPLQKIKNGEEGVYYYQQKNGWLNFAVSGKCPNLGVDLNCNIHESRYYPSFCRNFVISSIGCHDAQMINSVRELDM